MTMMRMLGNERNTFSNVLDQEATVEKSIVQVAN
jgi:hypothetical protein